MEKKFWLTTDTHFNHDKMVEYCDRPKDFEKIISKGLFSIPQEDILIHLGDVCIGNDEYVHNAYIKPLYCKKWLVRGNHDTKSDKWYLEHGWDFVAKTFSGLYFGKKVMFSHKPQEDNGFDVNIHGHFHNTLERLKRKDWVTPDEEYRNTHDLSVLTEKHKLLALEFTKYQPVLLNTFLK